MKRRYLYVLMFSVPILLASAIISLAIFGGIAGLLWLFIFGDNQWPSSANTILIAFFLLAFTASSLILSYRAYTFGKKEEAQVSLNTLHAMAAAGATVLLLLAIASYQWHIGNIGTKTNDVLCSEFCLSKGLPGSGIPPRNAGAATCSCFNAQGLEVVNVPMHNLVPSK